MDKKIESNTKSASEPCNTQNQEKERIQSSLWGVLNWGIWGRMLNVIKSIPIIGRLIENETQSQSNQQAENSEPQSDLMTPPLESHPSTYYMTSTQSQPFATSTDKTQQKSEAKLRQESMQLQSKGKNWNQVIADDESNDNVVVAKFAGNTHKAQTTFYQEMNERERNEVKRILLSKSKETKNGMIKSPVEIDLGNKKVLIKGKSSPENPKVFLVNTISITTQAPSQQKESKDVEEVYKHVDEQAFEEAQGKGIQIPVSNNYLQRVMELTNDPQNLVLSNHEIDTIFDQFFNAARRAGANVSQKGSHAHASCGILYTNRHSGKQLHLNQVRERLRAISRICVVPGNAENVGTN